MSVLIPFFNDQASFQEEVVLDEIPYVFKFTYNTRMEFWTMNILTKDLEPIVQGIKIVLSYELISRFANPDLPQGQLYALDSGITETEVTRDNLGNIIQLVYVEADEVDEFTV